jgi:two-component system, OmpR family, phosphate regulon response regulator PhoB
MKSILIVEDDPDLQQIFRSLLGRVGYEVHVLPDGRTLSERLPDLFIFDIELPFINGLELCKKVKSNPFTAHVPVLIVSASADLLSKASEVRADKTLSKPFDAKTLLETVRQFFPLGECIL